MLSANSPSAQTEFRHEALLYSSASEFLARTTGFIQEGLAAGEPAMVALDAGKLDQLREHLGAGADLVKWVDITSIGVNPARITSLWQEFVSQRGSRALRGIGEPVWPGRTAAELQEAHRHEALLNLAFSDGPQFHLLCPYDLRSLDPTVIEEARRTHPLISQQGGEQQSPDYLGDPAFARPFETPLPEMGVRPLIELEVEGMSHASVFTVIAGHGIEVGLPRARSEDLALAVLAAGETLRAQTAQTSVGLLQQEDRLICEISSPITIEDPLAGRRPPSAGTATRGLWLANQLCDLVELRSFVSGTLARLHVLR